MDKIYGLLGKSLKHSLSPIIHFMILQEMKMEGYYHLFETEQDKLKERFEEFKDMGVNGLNITIPYKIDGLKFVDELSEEARRIGAINTVDFRDGRLKGYNTDYFGFGKLLELNDINIERKRTVVLGGSGGAAKCIISYLEDNNASDIAIVTRKKSSVHETEGSKCRVIDYSELSTLGKGEILINCTPVGMYPNIDISPVSKDYISGFEAAIDIIYNPRETVFLSYARECGLNRANGLYMLVCQAVKAQEIWNGIKLSKESVMKIYHSIEREYYEEM